MGVHELKFFRSLLLTILFPAYKIISIGSLRLAERPFLLSPMPKGISNVTLS